MAAPSDFVKSASTNLEPMELLKSRISILLGVSEAAATALRTLQITSVFDLATSRVFRNAAMITTAAHSSDNAIGRFGAAAADMLDESARTIPIMELDRQPISALDGVGPNNAPSISSSLVVETIRDLALWPPYLAACTILKRVLMPESEETFDPEAPPDLLPKTGEYPTEKVFYSSVVIDEIESVASQDLDGQVDITALTGDLGYDKPATGAIISLEQAWYAQGVALGNLLHSVALAPGESTKIAMIDWSRRSKGLTQEEISQTEELAAEQVHSRAISEVTSAVATEVQSGFSATAAASASATEGAGMGMFYGGVLVGMAGGMSQTVSGASTVSASFGARGLLAGMTQNATDRTQQHANSARNRRASIVQEVTTTEKETITTRTITNYNHMHALTVQYYEVVQIYRVSTGVNRVEKCLFVPMKMIANWSGDLVARFLPSIFGAMTDSRMRRALLEGGELAELTFLPTRWERDDTRDDSIADKRAALETARRITSVPVAANEYSNWVLPAETLLESIDVGGSRYNSKTVEKITLTLRNGNTLEFAGDDRIVLKATLDVPVQIRNIASLVVTYSDLLMKDGTTGEDSLKKWIWSKTPIRATLNLSLDGATFAHVVNGNMAGESYKPYLSDPERRTEFDDLGKEGYMVYGAFPVISTTTRGIGVSDTVLSHLQANYARYSQAVWMGMDSATLSLLLSRYKYRGKPLMQQIDPVPVAVTGNYVGFRMNVNRSDKAAWDEWQEWLDSHGYNDDTTRHEMVPLPSGGVFAEAVLGRFNSAEKLDMTRFWNWQDSPIPFAAPDIAAIQAGTRKGEMPPVNGQLDHPIIQQVQSTPLPDPQGMGAVLNAITASNMFRDMSGLAATVGLAQAGMQATMQGAQSAASQAGANLTTAAQFQIEMLKTLMPLITAAAGAALGAPIPSSGGGGGSGGNISQQGAHLNQAAKLDQLLGGAAPAAGGAQQSQGSPSQPPRQGSSSGGGQALGAAPGGQSMQVATLRGQTNPLANVGDLVTQVSSTPGSGSGPASLPFYFAQVDVRLRLFIPSEIVRVVVGPGYGGDNRSFSYSQGTHRGQIKLKVDLDPEHASTVDQPGFEWGQTTKYDSATIEHVPDKPYWFYRRLANATPTETTTLERTPSNLNATVTRSGNDTLVVRLVAVGANPLAPGSPTIDADLSLVLWQQTGMPAMYSLSGRHDGFPAYELYLNGVRVYGHDPVDLEESPTALFGAGDFTVNMNWDTVPGTGSTTPT